MLQKIDENIKWKKLRPMYFTEKYETSFLTSSQLCVSHRTMLFVLRVIWCVKTNSTYLGETPRNKYLQWLFRKYYKPKFTSKQHKNAKRPLWGPPGWKTHHGWSTWPLFGSVSHRSVPFVARCFVSIFFFRARKVSCWILTMPNS